MAKHKQRKQSSYDIGQKIGQDLAKKMPDGRTFNQAFKQMYRGSKRYYTFAFSGAKHGFQNQRNLMEQNAAAREVESDLTETSNAVL